MVLGSTVCWEVAGMKCDGNSPKPSPVHGEDRTGSDSPELGCGKQRSLSLEVFASEGVREGCLEAEDAHLLISGRGHHFL
jgi:hypothetical protein